jgi:ribose 5-phosphate isomerase A
VSDEFKAAAARAAMAEVKPGMRLGLGTGSTAKLFVDLVGAEVKRGLDVLCVPTSEVTAAQARALGIRLSTLDETPELDLTVDGADEVGPGLALIKGAGGALLREKIVAAASRRMVVIADASKKVDMLGRFPLSIEVNPFGAEVTFKGIWKVLRAFDGEGPVGFRMRGQERYLTDGGHYIVDASFGRIPEPEALSTALLGIAGVVQHGLFIGLCQRAYIAGPDGIEVLDAGDPVR